MTNQSLGSPSVASIDYAFSWVAIMLVGRTPAQASMADDDSLAYCFDWGLGIQNRHLGPCPKAAQLLFFPIS
jgi:hypothetical protein